MPLSYEPQLATLVKEAPEGDAWLHELKYDGYRIGCLIEDGAVTLISRRGKNWTAQFAELQAAAARLGVQRALLDGEVAVVLPDGRTSFQALQNFFGGGSRAGLVYFAFDLLHLDGVDLAKRPLDERKAALEKVVRSTSTSTSTSTSISQSKKPASMIRFSDHVIGQGRAFFVQACRLGLEGIVSKQRALPYASGRNTGWVKTKCVKRQELVIGGFTDPEGSRAGLGALLVGYYQGGKLQFGGKVGTGFTHKSVRELRRQLDALEQTGSPFDPPPKGLGGGVHWVRPALVAEVAFAEWTDDGKARHPSFQGLREDKKPEEVVRENPAPTPAPATKKATKTPIKKGATKSAGVEVAGVRISHPERVLYPDTGVTKLDVARYHEKVGAWILPHVVGRPLTLVRCPEGLAAKEGCFYMKHSALWAPPQLHRIQIAEKQKRGEYLVVRDLPGVIALVQMNVLEIHTWGSTVDHLEQPDQLVFDLDPGPEVKWPAVIEAARLVRGMLAALELESFVKTTGGHGLHVVLPIVPERSWDDCLGFTRALAAAMARRNPAAYTVSLPKKGREKSILVDYLRNNRGSTAVAGYSTRARPGAPVSAPLTWEELGKVRGSDQYDVRNLPARLARLQRDPWAAFWRTRQRLTPRMLAAAAGL